MRVKAIEKVFYQGRDREIGETFDTENDQHAQVLMLGQKVMKAEDEQATAETTAELKQHRRSNRYKTRDMRARK